MKQSNTSVPSPVRPNGEGSYALLCSGPNGPSGFQWAARSGALAQSALGAKDIRIRVEAASINPIDVKRSQGYGRRLLSFKGAANFPLVLGNDVVGVVAEVGREVGEFRPGDRVVAVKQPSRLGTHAEMVDVSAAQVFRAPVDARSESLAVLPYSFMTMWLALRQAGIAGQDLTGVKVLVHGGSGALGLLALQVLSRAGAEITAMGGEANQPLMLRAGATHAIDRVAIPWAALQRSFDATLNFATWEDEGRLLACLRPAALGHSTTVHPLLGNTDQFGLGCGMWRNWREYRRMRSLLPKDCYRYGWTVFSPDRHALLAFADALDQPASQRLMLAVGLVAPMNQPYAAFEHVAGGRPGRAVLLPPANTTNLLLHPRT